LNVFNPDVVFTGSDLHRTAEVWHLDPGFPRFRESMIWLSVNLRTGQQHQLNLRQSSKKLPDIGQFN
jgi:hypothetical protein